jgi:hypothetical protein
LLNSLMLQISCLKYISHTGNILIVALMCAHLAHVLYTLKPILVSLSTTNLLLLMPRYTLGIGAGMLSRPGSRVEGALDAKGMSEVGREQKI